MYMFGVTPRNIYICSYLYLGFTMGIHHTFFIYIGEGDTIVAVLSVPREINHDVKVMVGHCRTVAP